MLKQAQQGFFNYLKWKEIF